MLLMQQTKLKSTLTADKEVYENPEKYFDQVMRINLSRLMPHVNGPFSPDIATPITQGNERQIKRK